MTLIAEHEFNDVHRCIHCGCLAWEQVVLWLQANYKQVPSEGDQRVCLERPVKPSEMMPEPRLRTLACEDADAISARLVELAKERLSAVLESEQTHMDYGDCCG